MILNFFLKNSKLIDLTLMQLTNWIPIKLVKNDEINEVTTSE